MPFYVLQVEHHLPNDTGLMDVHCRLYVCALDEDVANAMETRGAKPTY